MLTAVAPGELDVFRVARRATMSFAPPDWKWANPDDGTFGGRFDDPRGRDGLSPDRRFRVVYCATRRITALAETLAYLRTPISRLSSLLAGIDDDGCTVAGSTSGTFSGTFDPDNPNRAAITRDWRAQRRIGRVTLDPSLTFADVTTSGSFYALRQAVALALGYEMPVRADRPRWRSADRPLRFPAGNRNGERVVPFSARIA